MPTKTKKRKPPQGPRGPKGPKGPKMPPEDRVYLYWEERIGPKNVCERIHSVNRNQTSDERMKEEHTTVTMVREDIRALVVRGYPLTYVEYHLAIAFHFLLTELPYEEFYKTRWHETQGHFGYGPSAGCARCLLENQRL